MAAVLGACGCTGLGPYRVTPPGQVPDDAVIGARIALCVLGAAVGLGALNATREFLLVLAVLIGAGIVGLLAGIRAAKSRRELIIDQEALAQELTPSESALGFAAILVAAGYPLAEATTVTNALGAEPDSATPELFESLGMLAPPRHVAWSAALAHACAFAGGALAVAWPCWVTPVSRQFYPALACCLVMHYVAHGRARRWLREGGKDAALGTACLLLGKGLVRLLA